MNQLELLCNFLSSAAKDLLKHHASGIKQCVTTCIDIQSIDVPMDVPMDVPVFVSVWVWDPIRLLRLRTLRHKGQVGRDCEVWSQPAKHALWKTCCSFSHGTTTLWLSRISARQIEQLSQCFAGTSRNWKSRSRFAGSFGSRRRFTCGQVTAKRATKTCRR